MNIVIVTGNLTKDLNTKKSANGNTIANGTIAVNRNFKNSKGEYETDFINFSCFGATAEFLAKFTRKGDRVELVGSWNTRKYTDKDNVEHKVDEIAVSQANKVPTMKAEESKPKASQKKSATKEEIYDEVEDEVDINGMDLPF